MNRNQAVVLVIVLIAIGVAVGLFLMPTPAATPAISSTSTASTATGTDQTVTPDLQSYRNDTYGFTLNYPNGLTLTEGATKPTGTWRVNSQDPGDEAVNIEIPSSFDENSNFLGADFNVGVSRNNKAIANCYTPDPSAPGTAASTTVAVNGVEFMKFVSSDAGAGNLYETTSYRTLHAGACYAFEYTIHSTHVENYPAEQDRHEFDKAKVQSELDGIMQTVNFL